MEHKFQKDKSSEGPFSLESILSSKMFYITYPNNYIVHFILDRLYMLLCLNIRLTLEFYTTSNRIHCKIYLQSTNSFKLFILQSISPITV